MTIVRQDDEGRFTAGDVKRLYDGADATTTHGTRHGLLYYALIFWNLAALWQVRQDAFPDQREPLTSRALDALLGAIQKATTKDEEPQAIFFAAGLCAFMSPKSRDRVKGLLADKRLKVPKGFEGELTSRTFVSSFFGLHGLDLVRKQSVIPAQADFLWRQAQASPWRDASLDWLESTLPPKKQGPEHRGKQPLASATGN